MNIMEMPNGTIIINKRTGTRYELGEWVNDLAREIKNLSYNMIDYVNNNTQDEYELVGIDFINKSKLCTEKNRDCKFNYHSNAFVCKKCFS